MGEVKEKAKAKVSSRKRERQEKREHQESAGAGKSAGVATDYDLGVIYGGFDRIYYRMAEISCSAEVIGQGVRQLMPKLREEIPGYLLADVDRAIEKIYEYAKIARNAAYDIQVAIHRKRMGAK